MRRLLAYSATILVTLALATSRAEAQWPYMGYGMGGYAPFGPFAGFSPFGDYGFGPNASFGPWGGLGYGPYNYSQQFYWQQAYQSQQIYQAQQQAIVGQLRQVEGRLDQLDSTRQQLLRQFQGMSESDKEAVRAGLVADYLKLEPREREGWRHDSVVRTILGKELTRLDIVAEFQDLGEIDKSEFRQAVRRKYALLTPAEQSAWQGDPVVAAIMGRQWWLR